MDNILPFKSNANLESNRSRIKAIYKVHSSSEKLKELAYDNFVSFEIFINFKQFISILNETWSNKPEKELIDSRTTLIRKILNDLMSHCDKISSKVNKNDFVVKYASSFIQAINNICKHPDFPEELQFLAKQVCHKLEALNPRIN